MTKPTAATKSLTLTLPEASKMLGLGRTAGYELLARNEFPCRVIRAGKRIVVPRADLEKLLGLHDDTSASPALRAG